MCEDVTPNKNIASDSQVHQKRGIPVGSQDTVSRKTKEHATYKTDVELSSTNINRVRTLEEPLSKESENKDTDIDDNFEMSKF
ncbi:hypothetical protein QQ045_005769 [Rhodiola kirilowii]